jgi:enterochelin esterase family protein
MQKKNIIRLCLVLSMLWTSGIVSGQPPRGPMVSSPQINPDKTVTFRFIAPNAGDVKLSAQFEKAPVQMVKNERGVWSVTVGPVKPDIYPYNFVVDGVSVMDPGNEYYFPNERFKGSLLDIPGETPLIHSLQNVPHGSVSYEYYPSSEGTTGSLVIYTPPGYEKENAAKYPVFYLISGTTDTEETFFKVGHTNLILDNLIAQGKAKPMIVVMPYGNVEARIAAQKGGLKPGDPMGRESAEAVNRAKTFEIDLVKNIIPYVEKNYRVVANAENRAIGGFSRGGGQTLRAAIGNMDKFGYVCCYSAYLTTQEIESSYKFLVDDPARTNRMFKLLWVSVGNEDFLYQQTVVFMDYLKAKNINYKNLITTGGHTWMNVKTFMAESVPLLFK